MFSLIVKALCEWENGHFLKYRKDSLRNMYEFLYDFKSSEDFAERIEHYFVDNPEVLKTIQDRNKFNVDSVFDCLKTDPGILRDQLRRHREGMRDNLSLNFMFGMASIKVKDFSSENQAILKRALDQIINDKITVDDTQRAKAVTILERSLDYFNGEKKTLVLFLKLIHANYKKLLSNLSSTKIRKNLDEIEEYIRYEQINLSINRTK